MENPTFGVEIEILARPRIEIPDIRKKLWAALDRVCEIKAHPSCSTQLPTFRSCVWMAAGITEKASQVMAMAQRRSQYEIPCPKNEREKHLDKAKLRSRPALLHQVDAFPGTWQHNPNGMWDS
ncbi:hypothetical protein I7I51_08060 [Histoplasma capsulatum]|uniref:Uncharacterized protein n=1 Tax=Ajellomyces capsulatus TaxID=5037 RepID=A0A8A1M2G3_AJECA|nr:hypothetical protein I7I51_08060 [Histoplasma capsulatum]